MRSQKQEILCALRAGKAVTHAWAHRKRIYSLSRRICDLKADGHPIGKETVVRRSKHSGRFLRFANYFLIMEAKE